MNRVVITGIGCCTSLGWEQGGIARAFAGGCPAFAPSEALPGYSACPVSDLGDDAAYSRFSTWRHRRYLNRGAAFAVLSGLRAAASAGFTDLPDRGIRPHAGFRSGKRAFSSGF